MKFDSIWRKARKLRQLVARTAYRKGLFFGIAAAVEHEPVLRKFIVRTVVDIGANKGQFSLIANDLWPDATIIALEPMPAATTRFRRLFRDVRNVTIHEVAIGEVATTATLHVSRREDSSSLLPIGRLQREIFPGTGEMGTMEVRQCKLIDVVPADRIMPAALLKLDVQGYELEALKGCEELLHKFDYVYVECSFVELYQGQALAAEVAQYLASRGFAKAGQYNLVSAADGSPVQADLWFERSGAN